VRELILARHGESAASVLGVMNGDPAAGVALTAAGREQARRLGEALRGVDIGLCAVTELPRTQETAAVALAARAAAQRAGGTGAGAAAAAGASVPLLVLPALGEVRFGAWEGRSLDEYRTWALTAGPAEPCPGGGESRAEIAARLAEGFASLAARPETTVLCIGHSLPLRYLLDAAAGLVPAARAERLPYAEAFPLAAAAVADAAALLARWAERPAWRP
jgi:probable phosphoglycerate mutase